MAQHGLLVDRAFVGDLARVDRRRLVEQRSRARRTSSCRCSAARAVVQRRQKPATHGRMRQDVARGARRRRRRAARGTSRGSGRSAPPRTRDRGRAMTTSCAQAGRVRQDPRAQRADADPGAGRELEVLGQAAVEDRAPATDRRDRRTASHRRADRSPPRRTRRASVPRRASSRA